MCPARWQPPPAIKVKSVSKRKVSWPLGCSHTPPTASKRNNLHLLYAPAFASRQNNKDDLVKTLSLTQRERERDINTHYEQKTKADFFLQSKLSFQPSRSSNTRTELIFIYCQSHPIMKKTRFYKYTALPQYPHLLYLSSAHGLHHLLSTPPDIPVPITINKVFYNTKSWLAGPFLVHIHIHTYTQASTHAHTHTHTHTHSMYACKHNAHTHTHTHTHRIHVCMNAHTRVRTCIHKHTHTPYTTKSLSGRTILNAYTHTHTQTHIHVRTHTHTCAFTSIHAHTHHTPHTHILGAHAHKCTIDKFNPHNRGLWQ